MLQVGNSENSSSKNNWTQSIGKAITCAYTRDHQKISSPLMSGTIPQLFFNADKTSADKICQPQEFHVAADLLLFCFPPAIDTSRGCLFLRDHHCACHRSSGVKIHNNSAAVWQLAYEVVAAPWQRLSLWPTRQFNVPTERLLILFVSQRLCSPAGIHPGRLPPCRLCG